MSILHRRRKVKRRHLKRLEERGELTPREQDEADAAEELEEEEGAEESLEEPPAPPTREELEQLRDVRRRELEAIELQLTGDG